MLVTFIVPGRSGVLLLPDRRYMRSLPFELIEAARIDGAGPLRIFWSIVMPLIRPILTTVVVFQTMGTWNDFMNANVFLSSSELRTIVLQVYTRWASSRPIGRAS